MKTLILSTSLVVLASAASAHPSFAPHDHPHAASALAGLDVLLLAGLAIGFAAALAGTLRRR
jgi:hypothetical protein